MNLEVVLKAFEREGLKVIDQQQLEEVARWALSDFRTYEYDEYLSQSSPIIICGCGRSGTTLTRVILDTHSSIYSGPESLLFLPISISTKELSEKFNLPTRELNKLHKKSISRSDFIDAFFTKLLAKNKKTIWADKTARNIHCLEYILRHFPNAKIVNVVRNPLDVVASLHTHKKRKIENGEIINTGYLMPILPAIDRWIKSIKDGRKYRRSNNYYEVVYENLIEEFEIETKKLCQFLGVKFEKNMLQFHKINGHTRNYHNFPQNIEATLPLSKKSVGKYKEILNNSQINQVLSKTSKIARELGYWNNIISK